MGLETGNRIGDLVDTNPQATDDVAEGYQHLQLIKTCVQGSFPSLGSDQVTRTAAELSNTVLTFNGRPPDAAGEITPQGGDYTIGQLTNVDVTPTSDGDVLIYNSTTTNWESQAPSALPQLYPESGWYQLSKNGEYSRAADNTAYWPGVIATDQTAGLATVKNDNTGGTGWRLTADQNVVVTVSFSWQRIFSDAGYGTIKRFNSPDTFNLSFGDGFVSTSTFLPIDGTIQIQMDQTGNNVTSNYVSLSLTRVA